MPLKVVIHNTLGFVGFLSAELPGEIVVLDTFEKDKFHQFDLADCHFATNELYHKTDNEPTLAAVSGKPLNQITTK